MKRTRYLLEKWRRYPAADNDWLDVAQFLRSPNTASAKVCGRLEATAEPNLWLLASAGAQVEIEFTIDCRWSESEEDDGLLDLEILRSGDLICVELAPGGKFAAQQCRLLAPAGKQFKLASEFNFERARQWTWLLTEIRAFFAERDFTEMQTPTLVPSPGTEPFLDPFVTTWETASGGRTLYLPTSPEFHLKKILAAGWTRIFELKTCFRNGELGSHHQPEFMMLEWYRGYSNLERIAADVADLISWLTERLSVPTPQLLRTTMREVFARAFKGFVLQPNTTREELLAIAHKEGVHYSSTDTWDDVFFRLFLEKIENSLEVLMQTDGPILIHGYPPSQAALARIGADGFADRFEVYWRGFELANAFHELNDSSENLVRFNEDAKRKCELQRPAVPMDQGLLDAVEFGLPPSGGIALGVDRLFMAIFGIKDIAASRPFPFK